MVIVPGFKGFTNTVKTEWLPDHPRNMRLLEDIAFVDAMGREWWGRAGDIINGASIPWFFYRVIGPPFVGMYRYPSVIHDVYCTNKDRPYPLVHACFNEMMAFKNVPRVKRFEMYQAVARFGPRW